MPIAHGVATCQHGGMKAHVIPLQTRAERTWYAWHCLPPQASGERMSEDTVRARVKPPVAKGTISRAVRGQREPGIKVWERIADALGVKREWLIFGVGEPPNLLVPLGDLVAFRDRNARKLNPLEEAIWTFGDFLADETAHWALERYRGHELERTATEWAVVLARHDREVREQQLPAPAMPAKREKSERRLKG